MNGIIRRTKLATCRFCGLVCEGLLREHWANAPCVAPGSDPPVAVAGEVDPDPDPSVSDPAVPVDELPSVAFGAGGGVPMSLPVGNAGNVLVPATICWSEAARFETGPPGKV